LHAVFKYLKIGKPQPQPTTTGINRLVAVQSFAVRSDPVAFFFWLWQPDLKTLAVMDEAAKELAKLSSELELEEMLSRGLAEGEDDEIDDDEDGWVDENAILTDEERVEVDKTVKPVRLMLVKVS
jgi:hypothetical protein